MQRLTSAESVIVVECMVGVDADGKFSHADMDAER